MKNYWVFGLVLLTSQLAHAGFGGSRSSSSSHSSYSSSSSSRSYSAPKSSFGGSRAYQGSGRAPIVRSAPSYGGSTSVYGSPVTVIHQSSGPGFFTQLLWYHMLFGGQQQQPQQQIIQQVDQNGQPVAQAVVVQQQQSGGFFSAAWHFFVGLLCFVVLAVFIYAFIRFLKEVL